jgi:uncharacterized protein (TIGR02453 family)
MFSGFPEETVRFFLALRFHNEVSYFKAHEAEYLRYVKAPFEAFIEAMADTVRKISDDIELRPGKCLARIRRDTRFTKDKSPFRDHLWLLFRRSGEPREASAMYWFELSPEAVEWGLGFWGDNKPAMDALRRRMVHQPSTILTALEQSGLPDQGLMVYGDVYRKMKPPDELAEALRPYYPRKTLYIKRISVPLKEAYGGGLVELVSKDMLRLKPMYELLRAAADEAESQRGG